MKKICLMMVLAGFFLFQTMAFADDDVKNQEALATMDEIVVPGSRPKFYLVITPFLNTWRLSDTTHGIRAISYNT